ncbi:MAG: DUF6797 domain-containing protein [Rhodothermales bacterium]
MLVSRKLFLLLILPFFACQEAVPPPGTFILAESDLPAYESNLDHAALMSEWNEEFYHKGMVIYREACFACHGDRKQPGSIPSSRKFWSEAFLNGADPHSQYETLTRGYGLMPPQVRLTPREKYEVIHFIREEFVKDDNPDQYFEVTDEWLASLPAGDTLGPDPKPYRPWAEMNYGDFLMRTYELANTDAPPRGISGGRSPLPNEDFSDVNFAYKGIAIRLDEGEGGVAAGNTFVLFDHDVMRLTGFWTGDGFIDYEDILLNDRHNIFPRTVGQIEFENPVAPGWANPATGTYEDPRFTAVDGRQFGPLPREWSHYKGLYHHGDRVVMSYTVADANVLETYDLEGEGIVSRTLNVGSSSAALRLRLAPESTQVSVSDNVEVTVERGFHEALIPAGSPVRFKVLMSANSSAVLETPSTGEDLTRYTKGGPAHWPDVLTTPVIPGDSKPAYAVDVISLPMDNPWNSRMRPTGIDFLEGGDEAVVSTIDGEVWRIEGINKSKGELRWHRIATGLFQPLGIKVVDGDIYVGCRDQIVVLRDLNGDGETDFYESFNSDHQVTEHFHEFAMGLQTDDEGNFYYAKSARHARTALVPQHGTLIRVSPDGETSDIIATGFRAANGVAINPDGTFIVTDQEGHWNPMNRVNWVEEGGFYGNMYGYGAPADSSDEAMIQPLVWIDQRVDRSPAELVWADSDRWGPLSGELLSLSYGYGYVFLVLPQMTDNVRQGGVVRLPIAEFPTGIIRGRMNPEDGQLYVLGMSAWATNQMIQVGGIYRIRYTGNDLNLPVSMRALDSGMELTFAEPLAEDAAMNSTSYVISTWQLERTRNYGSRRLDTKTLDVDDITLSSDGRTVHLDIPDIEPTWIMQIDYNLSARNGTKFSGSIQNTIYDLEASD